MILSNRAKCLLCNDVIYSGHRHDFKRCSCGNLFVDGGMSYIRRGYTNKDSVEDMSIELPDNIVEACKNNINEMIESDRNDLGILCGVVRTLYDNGFNIVERNAVKDPEPTTDISIYKEFMEIIEHRVDDSWQHCWNSYANALVFDNVCGGNESSIIFNTKNFDTIQVSYLRKDAERGLSWINPDYIDDITTEAEELGFDVVGELFELTNDLDKIFAQMKEDRE